MTDGSLDADADVADPDEAEADEPCVLAIDIGGTKFAVAIVSDRGRVVARGRVPTPAGSGVGAETLWSALEQVIGQLPRIDRVHGVGVGCGGPMAWPAGEVSPLNIPAWRGFPLRQRLQQRFPGIAVRLHNDAICMAVGEHWQGAGAGFDDMLGMVVSTGVGGGLILRGRLVDGHSGNAGHVGHVVVDPAGPPCPCGARGCLEGIARGPAIAAWAAQNGWRPSGDGSASAVAADARLGDPVAVAAFERAGRAVGVALASTAALLDITLVVVGGGIAQTGELLFGPLRAALAEHAGMDFVKNLTVVEAGLGQDAGLVGAAALVVQGSRYWSNG